MIQMFFVCLFWGNSRVLDVCKCEMGTESQSALKESPLSLLHLLFEIPGVLLQPSLET